MDYTESLKAFPMLQGISDEDLKFLSSLVKPGNTVAGRDIIKEGDSGSEMYILTKGSVDIIKTTVYGDPFVVATLDASMHCVFGEMAMIDNDKRSATVRAKTDCSTLSMDRRQFDEFCDSRPASGVKLLRLIGVNLVRNIRAENNNLRLVYQALIEEIEKN